MAALLLACLLPLAACAPGAAGAASSARPSTGAAGSSSEVTGDVVVLAAASLTDVFTDLAADLEAEHPGVHVRLSFAGSSSLAQQVVAGAPADVLATASSATMATVADAGDVAGTPRVVATNVLQIAVPPGNPGGVTGLADLARPDLAVALCAPQVPCGSAARTLLSAAGVDARPDTLEQDVRSVLGKVELGEVDAGLVYRTDVAAAGEQVEGVQVAEAARASTEYPVAVLAGAPHPRAAQAFVDLVASPHGRDVLARAGFAAP